VSPARIIWCAWCLFWTALWSICALDVLGANPYLWQLQYGNDQRGAACTGFVFAAASAAAILLPVGGPAPARARQLAAWFWRARPAAQVRRYQASQSQRPPWQ
jgi:hypothetical protein